MATTSTGTMTPTTVGGVTRFTGLSSGLDIDSLVKESMTADQTKLDQLKQQEQLAQWRQQAYRSITTATQTFASKYFDLLSPTSLLSQSNFAMFKVSSDSAAVTASTTGGAAAGTHTINVQQLATAAAMTTGGRLTQDVQGTTGADYGAAQGESFVITVDGTARTVAIDASVTDAASLQAAVAKVIGAGKVAVSDASGSLVFTAATGSGVQNIAVSDPTAGGALTALGFGSGAVLDNRLNTTDTLATIANELATPLTFDADGQVALTINNVNFTFDQSETLGEVMQKVNQSSAGVTLKYDTLTDKLTLTAGQTGAGQTLTATESGSNFLTAALGQSTAGQDAKVTLDGQDLTRSTNTLTADGVTYTLSQPTTAAVNVTLTQDVDSVYNNITNFVNDYNNLISTINGKLSEQYDQDYPPLTDAQKSSMTDTQISEWNTQAQTGLLEYDPTLQSMVDNLRRALIDTVPGQTETLASIGITTGSYTDQGKLNIDTTKLKQAIADNPQGVMNLFSQSSTQYAGTLTVRTLNASQLQTRYNQEGLAYRFYDILQANIATVPDSSGNEGKLLQKAGVDGDLSASSNSLTRQINDYATQISQQQSKMSDEENNLYNQYSTMETYINQMNSQLAALSNSSQSGG